MDQRIEAAADDRPAPPHKPDLFALANLPPNIFSIVMATGIVSLAALGSGWRLLAWALFGLNALAYVILLGCLALRWLRHRAPLAADYGDHARAPGFFTIVAGTCLIGSQCALIANWMPGACVFWVGGLVAWCLLTYTILPILISATQKPPPGEAISGTWLLAVVGTEAVSVLGSVIGDAVPSHLTVPLAFLSLCFWLVGKMLYLWLISQIFYRIVFLPLSPTELAPPYWINMGAMAISTLAGLWLVRTSERLPLLGELLPFLKGMTLLFWATATWWIPLLLALGAWRHIQRQIPIVYEHSYWAVVFPLGMYAVCTQRLVTTSNLPFLQPIAVAFVYLSLAAWAATLLGMAISFATRQPHQRLAKQAGAVPQ